MVRIVWYNLYYKRMPVTDISKEGRMKRLIVLLPVFIFALTLSVHVFAKGHRSGEQIWDEVCLGCHDTGMMDAPLAGSAAFKDRLAKKGMDKLVENAIKGLNDMPPMGSCGDCSEAEIRAAIKFMLK